MVDEQKVEGRLARAKADLKAVFRPVLGVGLVVALLSLFLPNQYTSIARVLPKDPKSSTSLNSLAAAAAALGVGGGGGDDPSSAYVDILKSRWVSERLLAFSPSYSAKTWYFGKAKPRSGPVLDYLGVENVDAGEGKLLKEVVDVQRDVKSGLLTIAVTTTSPELSRAIAKEATRLLEDYMVTHSQNQASAKAEFAKQRHAETLEEAAAAEDRFRTFLFANRNYQQSGDPDVRLKGSRLEADLNLKRQIVVSLAMAREQALLDQKDNTPVLVVLDQGHLPVEKSKPSRALLVLFSMVMAGLGCVGYRHRDWLMEMLFAEDQA